MLHFKCFFSWGLGLETHSHVAIVLRTHFRFLFRGQNFNAAKKICLLRLPTLAPLHTPHANIPLPLACLSTLLLSLPFWPTQQLPIALVFTTIFVLSHVTRCKSWQIAQLIIEEEEEEDEEERRLTLWNPMEYGTSREKVSRCD